MTNTRIAVTPNILMIGADFVWSEKGLLRGGSPCGIWELSPEGYKFVEEQHKNQQDL